jgi:hypothetical protein
MDSYLEAKRMGASGGKGIVPMPIGPSLSDIQKAHEDAIREQREEYLMLQENLWIAEFIESCGNIPQCEQAELKRIMLDTLRGY